MKEIINMGNEEDLLDNSEQQEMVNSLLRKGIIFSIIWIAGFGSLIAFYSGWKARNIIKSSKNIDGIGKAWWCLIVGAIGMLIWFPLIIIGTLKSF